MSRKLCSIVLCLILVLGIPMGTLAAQQANIIQNVWIQDTGMKLICADAEESGGEYRVQVDGTDVPVTPSTVAEDGMAVTVFCLVDTSGSISQFKLRLIQETLQELSNSLGSEDNMVIATLGNHLNVGPILHTKEEREAAIGGLKPSGEDTNLYAGIVESFDRLTSDTSYNAYGCVVVLSDGMDKQDNGMTEQEVLNAVQAARRPLYTVALVEEYTERDAGKILGSFARSSYGGVHQTTANEGGDKHIRWDVSGSEFGSVIWASLQDMTVLYADLSSIGIESGRTEVRLDVTFDSESSSYSDYRILNGSELPQAATPTQEPAPVQPQVVVPETTDAPETEATQTSVPQTTEAVQEPGFLEKNGLWIVLAVVALILAIVLVLVKKNKDKKKQQEQQNWQQEPGTVLEQNTIPGEGFGDVGMTRGFTQDDIPATIPGNTQQEEETEILRQRYLVRITDIPYGTQTLRFTVNAVEQVTFGRDPKRATCLLNKTDNQLSGVHFALTLQKDYFCIQDMGSRNGTYLNGIPIKDRGWIKMQSGDKVRAGAYEYRVTIEAEN